MQSKRLLLVGGGHAHLGLLKTIADLKEHGVETLLLSPEPKHPYSGMAPGLVGAQYGAGQINFPVRQLIESAGGSFIEGAAARCDPEARVLYTTAGEELDYDVVSFNVGSVVPTEPLVPQEEADAVGDSIFPAKPVSCLELASKRIGGGDPPRRVCVVGGGPGGVELAANIKWRLGAESHVSLYAGSQVVPRRSAGFRRGVRDRLENLGVEVHTDTRVSGVRRDRLILTDRTVPAEMIILATGVRPPKLFEKSGLPTGKQGGLLVDRYLRSVEYPSVFGGGDCIELRDAPLEKVGVYAIRETKYLNRNIRASLLGGSMREFSEGGEYLLICNLADGYGVGEKRGIVFRGGLVGRLKDGIDRRFMRKYTR